MASKTPHPITLKTFEQRAETSTHPLTTHLLHLMTLKKSNLCVSADVTTVSQLLTLATLCGPSIVVLKTHYDLISNWDYAPSTGTGAKLQKLARKYGFLVFEDRKYGDIGKTVEGQYIGGSSRTVEWSNLVNLNICGGTKTVGVMRDAEGRWRERRRYVVKTDISVGTPRAESEEEGGVDGVDERDGEDENSLMVSEREREKIREGRKASIVSITTVSQHFEPVNSPRARSVEEDNEEVLPGIEEAPLERGLLLLAQMSSEGNFLTGEYTKACVRAAREHPDYVMGFIAQESLNEEEGDEFITMTPGCQLPPEGEDEDKKADGDGLGQQYNSPKLLVGEKGVDIVIVGRGIFKSADPAREAERYRRMAWEAYEERVGLKN